MNPRLPTLMTLGLLALDSTAAHAFPVDDPPPPPSDLLGLSLEELTNLKVTSVSKRPEKQFDTSAAIYVITRDDIRRSGATTIPEILRLAPGVQVARVDSDHWVVGVRGFGGQFSRSVLVLIDGRSVYTPLLAGVIWALQDTLIEDIERIEVIRGPGGTIWGANAVNGVINIITRSAKDTQGVLASATVGSVDKGIGELRYGGTKDDFAYRVYGKVFKRGAEFHSDQTSFDEWHTGQGGFRTDWKISPRDSLTIQGDAYTGTQGQSAALATFSPPAETISNAGLDVSGGNLRALWHRDLKGGSDLQVQGYYDRTGLVGPQLNETRNTVDLDVTGHVPLPGSQTLVWGFGGRSSASHFVPTIPTLDFDPRDINNSLYGAFVQDSVGLANGKLSLTAGSKFEHNNYTGWEVQPSGRIAWLPSSRATVWAAVTRAVRPPSEVEEGFRDIAFIGSSPLSFGDFEGSTALRSERLLAYEAGFRALLGAKVSVDLAAFYDVYSDLIDFSSLSVTQDPTPLPPHITIHVPYGNGLKAKADGFEVVPEWRPATWLQFKGAYSHAIVSAKALPGKTDIAGDVKTDEGGSPRHTVTAQALATFPREVELDASFRYVSVVPALSVKSYESLDLRLAWKPAPVVEFSIVGHDLLQDRHAEATGDPGPTVLVRRSVYAQLVFRK